ncbi:MAG: response regulator [Verrucomicrobia bacterium]|nr:response regulator [Verrucomicrobiota bacterium]
MSDTTPATLFVVDDDRGLLRLVEKSLKREGFAVSTAASGADAIAWLKANQPELLLLDLKLEDVEAREVITPLSELRRLPPFIIITGQGDERVAVEMMKTGALDYVVKDAQFQENLPAVVRRVLNQIARDKQLAAAEQALRISEERFRVALKNSPVMVSNQDTDLRYTWIHNTPIPDPDQTVIGKTDEELFKLEEADRLTQLKMRVLATGSAVRQEVNCTIGDETRIYDLTVEPLRENGRITGVTCAGMDITEHKRLEREVLQISEMEQRRIGQDLHDGICQHLTGIELLSGVLGQNLEKISEPHARQAEKIAEHVRDVIGQTRSLARGLSPVVLESEGLMAALGELVASTEKFFNVKCTFVCDPPVYVHGLITATHLFRIAQEAVTNAIKHGKAKEIEISLRVKLDKVVLAIKDNGIGFAPAQQRGQGMGLRIMQYRAATIGANLLIQRQVAGGMTVICFLPNPDAKENSETHNAE